LKKKKILLIGHPSYTLPSAIEVSAGGLVIDNTLKYTPKRYRAWTLSPYKESAIQTDPEKYRYYNSENILNRIVNKFFRSWSPVQGYEELTNPYKRYFIAILLEYYRTRPDIIVVHTTKLPWAVLIKRAFKKCKVIIYQHNSEVDIEFASELETLKVFDEHIFVSNFARQKLLAAIAHTSFGKQYKTISDTVLNGVNTDMFKPSEKQHKQSLLQKLNISEDSFVIIFCGRVTERKGTHILVDAFLDLPEEIRQKTYLLIVGSDDYNTNTSTTYIRDLQRKINDASAKEHVLFTGVLKNETAAAYYGISDLLVFPSIDLEGLPLVPLEAQACGVPVIASRIGGTAECLKEGDTGYFIDNINSDLLRNNIVDFFRKPEAERKQMSTNARKFILEEFTEKKMAERFYAIADKLLT
jgi:glycosyltransferase involved in cell wall biosynthesis